MFLATAKVEDFDRFVEVFSTRVPRSASCTGPRARRCSAIPTRRTASGRSSTGTSRLEELRVRPRGPGDRAGGRHKGRPQAAMLVGENVSRPGRTRAPAGSGRGGLRPTLQGARSRAPSLTRRLVTRRTCHGRIDRSIDQGRRHRRANRPAVVHGHRQRERGEDGDRRHQCRRAACSDARSSCTSRTARHRQRRQGRRGQARPAGQGRRGLRRHLQLDPAGHQGPAVVGAGRSTSTPSSTRARRATAHLLHRPGAGAAGRPADPVAHASRPARGASYLPSADYIWPHVLNERVREVVTANGGEIVGEDYFPLDHTDYGETSSRSWRAAPRWCSTPSSRPGLTPFLQQLTTPASRARGGQLVCTYFDENFLNLVPAEQVEGLYSCLDYYQDVERSVQPGAARPLRRALPGQRAVHRRAARARACTGRSSSGRPRSRRPARSSRTR